MTIETIKNEGAATVILDGRLDSTTAEDLDAEIEKLIDSSIQKLTIDLSLVDFISSKGLRTMVSAYRKMNNASITLINPNSSILEVLRVSGLLKIFEISESK